MSRSHHITKRKAVQAIEDGDEDDLFAYGLKRNLKREHKILRRTYPVLKQGRKVEKARTSRTEALLKKIMRKGKSKAMKSK